MTARNHPARHGGLIRPRHGGGNKALQPLPLMIGFLVGVVVMYTLMIPLNGSSRMDIMTTADGSSNSIGGGKDQWLVPAHKGWHPITVFFGTNAHDGLQIPPNQKWFSQVHQDEIVYGLLDGKRGYFIDLAANDAKEFSNTLALEQVGWDGLCIEPNPTYWYGLSHRKCTVVGALVGGSEMAKVHVKFRGVFGGIMGKMDNRLANRKKEPDAPTEQRYTAPFRSILNQFQVPDVIDYMSLDVEGAEFMIMQHFPFDKKTIRLMTVERPSHELKQLFVNNDYILLRRLAWWGETLWAHKSTGLTPDHPKLSKWEKLIDRENKQ